MKRYLADYAFLFSIAGIVILLDQSTKYLVRANLPRGVVFMPDLWLSRYVRIVHLKNSGATLNIFQNMGGVLIALPIAIGLMIVYYFPRVPHSDWMLRLALSLILGGASGNLIDRLASGQVTDFISIANLPVMNLADASIWIGAALLFLWAWAQERRKKSAPVLPLQETPTQSTPVETQDE
ncbi:MAG: signal peptidase II [Anaerolineales bacterium]|nr:signal peptidase II [Anaerolineales bacterium]